MKHSYVCHKCKHQYEYNIKWCIQSYWSESENRMIKCTGQCLERMDETS